MQRMTECLRLLHATDEGIITLDGTAVWWHFWVTSDCIAFPGDGNLKSMHHFFSP